MQMAGQTPFGKQRSKLDNSIRMLTIQLIEEKGNLQSKLTQNQSNAIELGKTTETHIKQQTGYLIKKSKLYETRDVYQGFKNP